MSENAVLIACSMLRPEIEKAMRESGVQFPTIWMEKGLHERPENLRRALQEQIDLHQDKDEILLAYCLCGNSTIGLRSERAALSILKFDDCIRMLLSNAEGKPPEVKKDCLYFTKEWMDSDKFILNEVNGYIERFGEENAAFLIEAMLKGYQGLNLVDDGSYDIESYTTQAEAAAHKLNLAFGVVGGSTRALTKLLARRADREICAVQPGETVSEEHFHDRPL